MDYKLEHQNTRTLYQFNTRSHFLKKVTQLLVSISVICFLLSHISNLSYLHSLSIYFPSNISLHLLSQTKDKNTMFLLCNGLLVLMKFWCLMNKSSTSRNNNHNSMDHMELEEPLGNTPQLGNIHIEYKEDKEIKELGILQEKEEDKEEGEGGMESGLLIVGKEMEGGNDKGEVEKDYVIEDKCMVVEGRDQGEEENELISIEELNKIFDEFIRKMKEGIRIEAQQQIVVVK